MSKIMVVGAGRVGTAFVKIIRYVSDHDVVLVDTDASSLNMAVGEALTTLAGAACGDLTHRVAGKKGGLDVAVGVERPDLIVCCTPFSVNVQLAELAVKYGCHYIDFTEDTSVTEQILSLDVGDLTFVPQTGLAPGLVSYLGLELFKKLGVPHSLDLRVGALPQVAFGPSHYAVTWSPEGLINEYLRPAVRKRAGLTHIAQPLSDAETLLVNGIIYEGFTTSGGVGNLDAYGHIPNVEYKTLRHPGHLEFIQTFLQHHDFDFNRAVVTAKKHLPKTRDDVVVLAAVAKDETGMTATVGLHFEPHPELKLTALELTTAGTGAAVASLLLNNRLPTGILRPDQIPMSQLRMTLAYELMMSCVRA